MNEINPNYLASMKFCQNIWFQFNFKNYLLKISYFVKKIILKIKLINFAEAKVKIDKNTNRKVESESHGDPSLPNFEEIAQMSINSGIPVED